MNLKEMLHLADNIVFEKTGQHLDDLQEAVLKGTLQHETYKHVAKDFDCSESRVRNAASELWQFDQSLARIRLDLYSQGNSRDLCGERCCKRTAAVVWIRFEIREVRSIL